MDYRRCSKPCPIFPAPRMRPFLLKRLLLLVITLSKCHNSHSFKINVGRLGRDCCLIVDTFKKNYPRPKRTYSWLKLRELPFQSFQTFTASLRSSREIASARTRKLCAPLVTLRCFEKSRNIEMREDEVFTGFGARQKMFFRRHAPGIGLRFENETVPISLP